MDEMILQVNHLSKSFGKHEVLKDINFTVKAGDVTSIIGASGSGKSTLLRCINLLERPNQGEVRFHGRPITGRGTDASAQNGASGTDQGTGTDAAAQTAQTNEYLAQGYYIVQEGDKLLDISRKVYGNDNMVAAICEANGITNIDHIQVGDRLQLPNP